MRGIGICRFVVLYEIHRHYIYIYTFQRDTYCCSTDCLLMLRCQLYMFRTVTVHRQELLFRCCTCRLWYVVRTALSDTSHWYSVWATLCISLECMHIAKMIPGPSNVKYIDTTSKWKPRTKMYCDMPLPYYRCDGILLLLKCLIFQHTVCIPKWCHFVYSHSCWKLRYKI